MVRKYTITFREVDEPIREPVTKFGGQPVWLAEPRWPLSRSTGKPMRFICQIALDETAFGPLAGRMAYLFMTDEQATGPTLEKGVARPDGTPIREFFPVELAVEFLPGEDPDTFPDAAEYNEDEPDPVAENKVGGSPAWLQGEEYLSGGPWKLLLQFDSAEQAYDLNFGDAGVGYAFISVDGRRGKFLWQCA